MSIHYRFVISLAVIAMAAWPAFAQPEAEGPRPGKYRIFTIPTAKGIPLFLGWFELEKGGRYKAHLPGDRLIGEGEYEYQATSKSVVWKTGPYKEDKWGGRFFVTREGKSHEIYLKPSTRATNSIDAK